MVEQNSVAFCQLSHALVHQKWSGQNLTCPTASYGHELSVSDSKLYCNCNMAHYLHYMILHSTVHGEVHLTQQSPLGLPCSGEEVILQCTLPGMLVFWRFPGGEITLAPGSMESPGSFQARPVGVVNGSFTSTLTFPAENGTVITCINGLDRSMNSTKRVRVQGIY